jgi:hypothetical protein
MYPPVDTFEVDGFTVELHQDYDAGNPYKEWDQASEILSAVRDYDLGDSVPVPNGNYYYDGRGGPQIPSKVMARWLTLFGGYVLAIPFTFQDYGSSGARTWLTTPDDDPADGWLVLSKESYDKEFGSYGMPLSGDAEHTAEKTIRAEFDSFRSWIESEVLGFVIKDPAGQEVDSCWGFYGDDKYIREEATSIARGLAAEYVELRKLPWLPTFGNPIQTAEGQHRAPRANPLHGRHSQQVPSTERISRSTRQEEEPMAQQTTTIGFQDPMTNATRTVSFNTDEADPTLAYVQAHTKLVRALVHRTMLATTLNPKEKVDLVIEIVGMTSWDVTKYVEQAA